MMKATSGQGTITIENDTLTVKAPFNPPVFQVPVEGVTVSVQRGVLGSKVTFHSPHGEFTCTMVSKSDVEKILGEMPEVQAPSQPAPPPVIVPEQPKRPQTETKVKAYNTPREYQKDVQKMQKDGWSVLSTTDHTKERSLAGKLFVPGGMFTKGKSQIVVTYQRVKV